MIKEITRSLTLAIEDKDTRKVKGFVQVFIMADRAFIHSLIGKNILGALTKDSLKSLAIKHRVNSIEFVMEPQTCKILSKHWVNIEIGEETTLSGKPMNWVRLRF